MTRTVFVLLCLEGAVLSFNVAASAALVPSIAAYFGVSQYLAGKLVWIYMLPYGLAALFYGPLARQFAIKKIELVCLFFFSLANILAAISWSIDVLFWARLFLGLFGASVTPLVLILIANHSEEKTRGKTIGNFFAVSYASSLLGLFLSGIVPWRVIFWIPGIFGILVWIHIWMYLPSFKQEGGFQVNYLAAFKSRQLFIIFTYIFIISLLYHGAQQWLAVYFSRDFLLNQFTISMLITLTSLSGVFGEIFGGKLADKKGRLKTMEWGLFLMAASLAALFFKSPVFVLSALMITWGMGWTFNHAGVSAMLTDLPKKFVNEAASLNSSVRFISGGAGALAANILIVHFGFKVHFGTVLVLLIALGIVANKLFEVKAR